MGRYRPRLGLRVWTLRRPPPGCAACPLLEVALAAGATISGVAAIVLAYRHIIFGTVPDAVTTASGIRVVGGVQRVVTFRQRVIPVPGSHPPAVWPFVGLDLLLGLLPVGAALHAPRFGRFGLVLSVAGMAFLALGLGPALVAGRLLPSPLLLYAAGTMLPALALALAAVILGIAIERGDEARIPID